MKTGWIGLIITFLLLGIIVPSARSTTCLEIQALYPSRTLISLPLADGESFALEFINSIYLAPVRETLMYWPEKGLCLTKVESPSAGVFEYYGLPTDGTGAVKLERRMNDIRLKSHDYEHHRIVVGTRSIRLKGLVADGEAIVITVNTEGDCSTKTPH